MAEAPVTRTQPDDLDLHHQLRILRSLVLRTHTFYPIHPTVGLPRPRE